MLLEGVKVEFVNPDMPNTKMAGMSALNHMESVSFMYEKMALLQKCGGDKIMATFC